MRKMLHGQIIKPEWMPDEEDKEFKASLEKETEYIAFEIKF